MSWLDLINTGLELVGLIPSAENNKMNDVVLSNAEMKEYNKLSKEEKDEFLKMDPKDMKKELKELVEKSNQATSQNIPQAADEIKPQRLTQENMGVFFDNVKTVIKQNGGVVGALKEGYRQFKEAVLKPGANGEYSAKNNQNITKNTPSFNTDKPSFSKHSNTANNFVTKVLNSTKTTITPGRIGAIKNQLQNFKQVFNIKAAVGAVKSIQEKLSPKINVLKDKLAEGLKTGFKTVKGFVVSAADSMAKGLNNIAKSGQELGKKLGEKIKSLKR